MLALKVPDASSSRSFVTPGSTISQLQEPSAQGQVSVPPTVHTGQGPGTPAVRFSQVGCMMNRAGRRLDKPSGPGGTWEAWRAKDSKDVPRPRSRPWEGQEAAGAATSSQRGQGLHQCSSASTGQEYSLPPPAVAALTTVLWGPYTVAPSRPTGPDGSAHLAVHHAVQALTWNPTPRTSS